MADSIDNSPEARLARLQARGQGGGTAAKNLSAPPPSEPTQAAPVYINNPDGTPVAPPPSAQTNVVQNTPPQEVPLTTGNTITSQSDVANTNVVKADNAIIDTANQEIASQQGVTEQLNQLDTTQKDTKIQNATANQLEAEKIQNDQIILKTQNEIEYQKQLQERTIADAEALRLQQKAENNYNLAAAAEMKAKQEAAERDAAIANDIALQKSNIAFAKLGLSFSGAAINTTQSIYTSGIYNLSTMKATNAKNYADIQLKISNTQFNHTMAINKIINDAHDKEFASKERLRSFIGDAQNNILKSKKEAQDDIQKAIDDYKIQRQAREDKLYADMNAANSRVQAATKDIQNTINFEQEASKKKIDGLISNGQWASLSPAQQNEIELRAGIPVGTTTRTATVRVTTGINDRLKAVVGAVVAVPKVILDKMQTEIQGYMGLGYPMQTAIQMTVDKYKNSIPDVKKLTEANALKSQKTQAEIDKLKAEAKRAEEDRAGKAAIQKANRPVSSGRSRGPSSPKTKAYVGTDAQGRPLIDKGGIPYSINPDGSVGTPYLGQIINRATPQSGGNALPTSTPPPAK